MESRLNEGTFTAEEVKEMMSGNDLLIRSPVCNVDILRAKCINVTIRVYNNNIIIIIMMK